jgi:hypothetical protein
MSIRQVALSAVFAAGIAALAPATASAQYYYSPLCNPFPLTWPFCIVGGVVYGVGYVVTAPFRAFAPPARPYYYGYYGGGPAAPPAPPYSGPPPYGPPGAPPEYNAPPPR